MNTALETWQKLETAVGNWISRPAERPKTDWVLPQAGDRKAIAVGRKFEPEASYFSIRLVEMGLAKGGEFFTDFLPLGVCLTEYTFGDERQRHPMVLSNDLIASQIEGSGAKPAYVEYNDMYAIRYAPVKNDTLSLFVGLFSLPYNDIAKRVLQIASDLTQQIGGDVAGLASGLRVADKVYDGVSSLFGLKGVKPRFGYANGNALSESGYLLVRGPTGADIDLTRLAIVNDKLQLDSKRAAGFDYCLVAIEHAQTRLPQGDGAINSLTGLAFHKRFRQIGPLLTANKMVEAEALLAQVRADVVTSLDLTEDDRLVAVAAYNVAYDKLRRALAPPTAATTRSAFRGANFAASLDAEAERGQNAEGAFLKRMATRVQMRAESKDADVVFAKEAIELRREFAEIGKGTAPLAVTLADSISGAVARSAPETVN